MERSRACLKPWILLHLFSFSVFFIHSDARRMTPQSKGAAIPKIPALISTKRIRVTRHLDSPSNTQPYVSSPFTLPPYDSLPPIPLPDLSPPYCIYPPLTPQPPASTTNPPPTVTIPSPPPYVYIPPTLPFQSPPPSPTVVIPGPPESFPSPPPSPTVVIPGPPESLPSPVPVIFPIPPGPGTGPSLTPPTINPPYSVPSPSISIPSPPSYVPSPGGGGIVPSPTIFLPPIVYPPPAVPPPPNTGPSLALWCVAKPSVPEPIIQEAMNYACGSGADCASIEPQGSCFQPNTLFAHASYAFNSYWQRTKVAGGSCSFGGTAMLVTVDPSYDGCHFLYL